MHKKIVFFVDGVPKPAGSKTPMFNKYTNKTVIIDACKLSKKWKQTIAKVAVEYKPEEPIVGPVKLSVLFLMPRPKCHYRSGKFSTILKEDAPQYHIIKPDSLKLTRAVEDALTGIIYADDSQIVKEKNDKRYAGLNEKVGVWIKVETIE